MELDDDYANSVRFARLSRTVFKKPSDKHYLSPNAPRICSLDSCNVGKQTLSPGQTLKYCTGCYLVMYCCRDHQIEDRKGHKSFCIHAANKSPDVLLQLLNDWIHLHMMAIETAASYAIEFPVPYDVERYFWAVYMEYLPNKGGNPATSFRIVKTKMMGFDDTHPDCASPRQFRNENPIEDGDRDIGLCAPDRRGGVVVQFLVPDHAKSVILTQIIKIPVYRHCEHLPPRDIHCWQEKLMYTVDHGVVPRQLKPDQDLQRGLIVERNETSWEWKAMTRLELLRNGINPDKVLR